MPITFCALFKNSQLASRSPWLLLMVFLLLAVFCLFIFCRSCKTQPSVTSRSSRRPPPHPSVHLIRCLSPCSQSSVYTLLSQLLLHRTRIFTFFLRSGWGAAQGQGPEYSTVAWGRCPQRVRIGKQTKALNAHTCLSLLCRQYLPAVLNLCPLLMIIKSSQADCAMLLLSLMSQTVEVRKKAGPVIH